MTVVALNAVRTCAPLILFARSIACALSAIREPVREPPSEDDVPCKRLTHEKSRQQAAELNRRLRVGRTERSAGSEPRPANRSRGSTTRNLATYSARSSAAR